MKYIKIYELFSENVTSKLKSEEYEKYLRKYVIFKYNIYSLSPGIERDIYLAFFRDFSPSRFYLKLDIIESTLLGGSFHREPHILDIKILESFDSLDDATKRFEILVDAEKYNL